MDGVTDETASLSESSNAPTEGPKVRYTLQTLPPELHKYWYQRKRLFSRYDEGVWMDKESWYSVTPEGIARHLAQTLSSRSPGTIVDAFCGVGGNTIQFAKYFDKVIAIDNDPVKIACAKHNAKIYGVLHKIEFVQKDFFDCVFPADAIFLSPPWGGPSYNSQETFDLESMKPYPLSHCFNHAAMSSPNIAMYLPKTSDIDQITALGSAEIQYLYTSGRCKALCAYFGLLALLI